MEDDAEVVYGAGQHAPPGRYVRVDVSYGRIVVLERHEALPASLDGAVAIYHPLTNRHGPTDRSLSGAYPPRSVAHFD